MSIETTSDPKAEARFRSQHTDTIKELVKCTHFKHTELEALSLIYFKMLIESKSKSNVPRSMLRLILTNVLLITDDLMIDRVIQALDSGTTKFVTLDTWLRAMSLLLRGTFEEKVRYCFAVYDLQGHGIIKCPQMVTLMSRCFDTLPEAEAGLAAKDLVDIMMKKMDMDNDGMLSFDEYQQSVVACPDMLQCLGQCLPDREAAYAFLATFTDMDDNTF